jgi:hypothetical protein
MSGLGVLTKNFGSGSALKLVRIHNTATENHTSTVPVVGYNTCKIVAALMNS